jgi:simple sugar transport system ATP-binding protein
VNGISFAVHKGEILGVAGVEGNGQTELVDAIVGMRKPVSGSISLLEKDVLYKSVGERLKSGLAHIPQDRIKQGLALFLSLTHNLVLGKHDMPPISRNGLFNWDIAKKLSRDLIRDYAIKAFSPDEPCKNLSGGNMQKVVAAREISRDPKIIIACQPTRGVDIGASEYIRQMLIDIRDKGSGVLLISADLDEIMELSDRIIVMYEGKKTGEMRSEETDEHNLGKMMFGDMVQEED